jgi:hypothetical protein
MMINGSAEQHSPGALSAARRVSAKNTGDPKGRLYACAHRQISAKPIGGEVGNPQRGSSEQEKIKLVEYLKPWRN